MTTIADLLTPKVEMQIPAPFGWPGGKNLLKKRIISLMPPHKTYVEPMVGAGSVFWAKPPSEVEVLNDLDPDLMRFYRDIGSIDHCSTSQLIGDLESIRAKEGNLEPCEFLTDVLCSFGSMRSHGGVSLERCQNDAPRFHKYLRQYQERLKKTKLHNEGWEKVVRQYDAPDTFFYFDPPYHGYPHRLYLHDEDQLDRLAQVLPSLKGKWLLTYDDHPDVKKAFKNFHILPVQNRYSLPAGSNNKQVTELLIANYPIKLEMNQDTNEDKGIEWDQWYTEKMTITHLILLEDHLLDYGLRSADDQCKTCMLYHAEKLKGYSIYEAPKFFEGEHNQTYLKVSELAQSLQDNLEDLTQPEALEYARKVRDLRYELVAFGIYDFAIAQKQDNHFKELEDYIAKESKEAGKTIKELIEESNKGDRAEMSDVFTVDIGVADIEKTRLETVTAAVDTGSTYTTIPRAVAEKLGLRYEREQRVETSDKRVITKSIYIGRINLKGKSWVGEIAADGVSVLGANTLQGLAFRVNPKTQELEEYVVPQYFSESKEVKMSEEYVSVLKDIWEDAALVCMGVAADSRQREGLRKGAQRVVDYIYGLKQEAPVTIQKILEAQSVISQYEKQNQPQRVIIWKNSIEEEFVPDEEFHPDSYRMPRPLERGSPIRVYLGCLKKHHWHPETLTCDEGQTVHKIVMPKTPYYLEKALAWKDRGVPIIYREEEAGVEPRLPAEVA